VSIWSTLLWIDSDLFDVAYGPPNGGHAESTQIDGYIDVATARSWYGGFGVRLSVNDGQVESSLILTASNVKLLVDALAEWLDATSATDDEHPA
jgi:hypothetical protein